MKVNLSIPKISMPKRMQRYYKKNTLSAQYNRQMDKRDLSALLFVGECLRFPQWNVCDIGICSILATYFLENRRTLSNMSKSQDFLDIKSRAKNIHEISKSK